jgi:signal transduction histidine kinase/ligand-binding sensor domain-containing protein
MPVRTVRASFLGVAFAGLIAFQSAPLRAANDFADYSVTSWTRKDGLAGPIRAITQDANGYLWLASDQGLVRFDGVRFRTWEAIGGAPLPNAGIATVFAASDGSLWLGFDENGGLAHIQGTLVRTFGAADGLPSAVVGSVAEDRARTIWAGTNAGLFHFAEGTWTKVAGRGLPDSPVAAVFVDSSGTLWVATSVGVFWRPIATDDRFQPIDDAARDVRALGEDPTGRIWITDPTAGLRLIGARGTTDRPPVTARGSSVARDRNGDLWFGTLGQGVWRIMRSAATAAVTVQKLTITAGLSSDTVRAMFVDRDGNVWAGSNEGLDRMTPHRVSPLSSLGPVSAVDAAADGRIWLATSEELRRFSRGEPTADDEALSSGWQQDASRWRLPSTRALRVDSTGVVWVATDDGVYRLIGDRLTRFVMGGTPAAADVLAPDSRGRMWLVRDRDIARWDGSRVDRFEHLPPLENARATSAYVDRSDKLWLTLTGSRVVVLANPGDVRFFGPQDGLGSGPYAVVFEDRQGAIWIGGSDGVTRLADSHVTRLARANGFPGGVLGIEEDRDGQLWLATSSGIVRLDPGEAEQAANAGRQVRYSLYDLSDGLAGFPESFGDRSAARAVDGTLWFVTSRGATIIDPLRLRQHQTPIRVDLEEVRADERRMDVQTGVRLPPGMRTLQIGYTTPSLTFPLKTRFRYRLDGFDADWIDAGTRRTALYTNLPPREYTFRVMSTDEDGNWLEPDATWAFSIRPMVYQSVWFYPALVTALAALAWGAWELRVRQLRRDFALVLRERVRLSWELHDTLLQSLVGVALQFDSVSKHLDSSSSAAKAQVIRIREQVEEYIREARRSIWALRSPSLETRKLAEALLEAGERLTADQPARFEMTTSGAPVPYPSETEHQLLRIGQEAMLNAVRHARASTIRVELEYASRDVTLRVIDDGIGFDPHRTPADAQDHYGLTTMRERAQRIAGTLRIARRPGGGTVVEVVVPMPMRPAAVQE